MTYNKNTWNPYNSSMTYDQNKTNGGVVDSAKLNNMETGISNAFDKTSDTIGGRNLYLNSKAIADGYSTLGGATVTVQPFDDTTNMWHIVAKQGAGGNVGIYFYGYANEKMPNSSDWAYSADVKGTAKTTWFGIEAGNHKPIVGTVGSEWSRVSQTGHFDNAGIKTIVMYFDSTDSPVDVYIKLPKLELGNMPTDWTPAPEDKVNVSDMRKPANDVAGIEEVSTLQTQVDNSAVGTNLLTNTGDLSANWAGITSISTTTEYNGHPSMGFTSSTKQLAIQPLSLGELQNSTKYITSFWAKADNAGDKAHTELWGSNGATDFVLTTNWVRYTAVVTSYSDANTNTDHSGCYFRVPDGNKGNVYIALPKLEKGSVATDWCPNPEDKVNVSDMRKPASDVVGLEDISTGLYRGSLAKNTDLNTLTQEGIYDFGTSLVNFIDSDSHWGTIQIVNKSGLIVQYIICGSNISDQIFFRTKSGIPATWYHWTMVPRFSMDNSLVLPNGEHFKPADDSEVVHLDSNNTLSRTNNFTGPIQHNGNSVGAHIQASNNDEDSAINDSAKGNSDDIYYWFED